MYLLDTIKSISCNCLIFLIKSDRYTCSISIDQHYLQIKCCHLIDLLALNKV